MVKSEAYNPGSMVGGYEYYHQAEYIQVIKKISELKTREYRDGIKRKKTR